MIEIKPNLKILILEANPYDVILMKELILNEISEPEFYYASNRQGYLQALDLIDPDIVLSDNCFPQFTAKEALEILRKKSKMTPFILVTESVSEEQVANIIEQGASDYIQKDSMEILPSTIKAALKQRDADKEIVDYRYALNEAAIVVITDREGFLIYVNENYCKISGYQAEELTGNNRHILHAGFNQSKALSTIQSGNIWHGEFLNLTKNGNSYLLDTIIIPLLDEKNEPCRYLAISNNIAEKKKIYGALLQQQQNEQLKMTDIALAAQEKERNIIGQELHDNVNQILVATKLLLSVMIQKPGGDDELLKLCSEHIYNAIEENRKIARVLVTPNLETETLSEQLKMLSESMLTISGLKAHIDTCFFNEDVLNKSQKLTIYRIAQEQCTNIVKHAAAKNVFITLQTSEDIFKMTIADDGRGISTSEKIKGTGLKNIAGRIGILNGTVRIISSPGCGFTLEIEIPVNIPLSQTVRNE